MAQGILNLDKPAGITSARAVDRIKRLLPRGTKVGHAGTLDPFATGVLLVLVGSATKKCESLMNDPKQYEAVIKFGSTTATDDLESEEIPFAGAGELYHAAIEGVLPRFVGLIQQRPSAFSAMKVAGRRAYALARSGLAVELQARPVNVYGIDLIDFAWPLLRLRIDCGRGTYIRALARDIGEALQVGGHLRELRRTRVGAFWARDAVTLEQVDASNIDQKLQNV